MLERLRIIQLSDARQRPRTIDALSFREDGSLAMLCRNDPLSYAFDLDADSLRVLTECAGDVSNPSSRWRFSADGASVIASSLDGVAVFRVDSGAERWSHQERVWPAPLGYTDAEAVASAGWRRSSSASEGQRTRSVAIVRALGFGDVNRGVAATLARTGAR